MLCGAIMLGVRMNTEVKDPPIYISHLVDLWGFKEIGAYLKRSPEVVRERIATKPDFPKAIRIPTTGAGRAHALYKAREVIKWAESYSS